MVKGRFSLPDRWTDYDAVGDVIPGTRFIAFKVPLRLQYFHRKGLEREIFTTSDLNEKLGDKLRLVVDLSCKQVGMYYNPEDLEKNGIRYEKLRVEGKKVPSEHIIKRFKRIVTEFEKRQPEDYYIGVHCTHGVNRTGYVICRYMIEQLSKTTDEALRAFESGRGHPLERENYIEALHKFEKKNLGDDAPTPRPASNHFQDSYHHWQTSHETNSYHKMNGQHMMRPDYYTNHWSEPLSGTPESANIHHNYDDNCYGNSTGMNAAQHCGSRPITFRGTHHGYPGYHMHHGSSKYKWEKGDKCQERTPPGNIASSSCHEPRSHTYFP
ncbi:RNA/RNP complex-1-interacting phosphatase homolog isoform X7 [Apostichopus japonicus]|uniref:RNA/RNP complex-1-interacting phosphatase homolog isoform X7 n=1 Tax=Stichopus japonicus TaxID=307972 RepID=UPI003AB877EF